MTRCHLYFFCFHGGQVTVKRAFGYSETMPVWMFWTSVGITAALIGAGLVLFAVGMVKR